MYCICLNCSTVLVEVLGIYHWAISMAEIYAETQANDWLKFN